MTIQGKNLVAGRVVEIRQQGLDNIEEVKILGVTDNTSLHGKDGVKFTSVKQALADKGVKTLAELQALDDKNEHGFSHFLCVQNIAEDYVYNMYLYEGRWAQGSGAYTVSFLRYVE